MAIRNENDRRLWLRIKSIEKKIEKLGPKCSKGFNWVEWDGLEEELAILVSKLSVYNDIAKNLHSKYD